MTDLRPLCRFGTCCVELPRTATRILMKPELDSTPRVISPWLSMRRRRVAIGLCARCPLPAVSGRTLCATHKAEYQFYAQKNRDKIAAYKRSIQVRSTEQKRSPANRAKKNINRRKRKLVDLQFALTELL